MLRLRQVVIVAEDLDQVVDALCRALVETGRWEQVTATKLAEDVFKCGPAEPAILQAA